MKPLILPIRIESESNKRGHWSKHAKRTKTQRGLVCLACRAHFVKPSIPCTIRLTRIAPRELDQGNIAAALKAVQDGCADWLGIDDRKKNLVKYEYENERGGVREYALKIEVLQ